ncbi:MAG: hypothetical protein KDK60_02975 [Chlamydiia bacterium]|nr:hypothetical protein [Chlamydiia bacterium]
MDFTREPLVETVITPKEGFKLVIRASHGNSDEEYSVGAVEVVSFGNCYFFRSLEKPKSFLLPMTEYEIVEARETRTVLKKAEIEKSIKIGGGKKTASKSPEKEVKEPKEEEKKREKKRTRKRRSSKTEKEEAPEEKTVEQKAEKPKEPPVRRTLLPPPTSLISEQIDRYKDYLTQQGAITPEDIKEAEKAIEEEAAQETPEEKIIDISDEAHVPPRV